MRETSGHTEHNIKDPILKSRRTYFHKHYKIGYFLPVKKCKGKKKTCSNFNTDILSKSKELPK